MSIEPSHKILRKNISSKNLSNPCSLIISLPDLLHKSLPLKFYAKIFHRKTCLPPVHPGENKQRQHIENRNPKKVIYIRVFDFDDFQIFRFFRFSEFFRYFFDTHDYESNDIMMCV